MENTVTNHQSPVIDPKNELPAPPKEKELPAPHDMFLESHVIHRHPWLHWMPAILGLLIGVFVGVFFMNDAAKNREAINQYYTISPTPSTINQLPEKTAITWNTFKNESFQFAINYPNTWTIHESIAPSEATKENISFNSINDAKIITLTFLDKKSAEEDLKIDKASNQAILINGIESIRKETANNINVFIPLNNNLYVILNVAKSNEKIFLDMLSSILIDKTTHVVKHIQKPVLHDSVGPVFCTEDVKQCPDGSWVHRAGPRCEFLSCTTNQP